MTDGVTVRMEDLGLDSLELLDLVMGLEEDFKVGLAIENLTNRMRLDEVFAEIQRLQREQGSRGAGIA
ncbi:acyl carrier protein [Thioalkalivibrio sp. AKL10]|uniref:acyl carrier protein n=1 Tax=Thioalkalivibrio sp. AKL10 TaxID=1158158 RepID=UPI002101A1B4|nr:acyl carrier protein [Thioalkalivibrio sp. AKL10]